MTFLASAIRASPTPDTPILRMLTSTSFPMDLRSTPCRRSRKPRMMCCYGSQVQTPSSAPDIFLLAPRWHTRLWHNSHLRSSSRLEVGLRLRLRGLRGHRFFLGLLHGRLTLPAESFEPRKHSRHGISEKPLPLERSSTIVSNLVCKTPTPTPSGATLKKGLSCRHAWQLLGPDC